MSRFEPGDRVEIRVGRRDRFVGVVVNDLMTDDGSAYASEVQVVRIEVADVGVRAFRRPVSARGSTGDWSARARDFQHRGRIRISLAGMPRDPVDTPDCDRGEDWDAAEEDAVREMFGDDGVAYEQATGKRLGCK